MFQLRQPLISAQSAIGQCCTMMCVEPRDTGVTAFLSIVVHLVTGICIHACVALTPQERFRGVAAHDIQLYSVLGESAIAGEIAKVMLSC
jgi:hypothetical protein